MALLAHPLVPRLVAPAFFLPGVLWSDATDRASLALLLVPGVIFVATAVLWATNGHGAWVNMLRWERERPRQRAMISRQTSPTPENPAARVLYVHVIGLLGLAQLAAATVGILALVT